RCRPPQRVVVAGAPARFRTSTGSIHAFWNTPQASLVPPARAEIAAPTYYVRSSKGPVPQESVVLIKQDIPAMSVIEVDAWAAHLEDPAAVIDAARSASG